MPIRKFCWTLLLFVAKYDVIVVLSRATRIQRKLRQRRFPLLISELGDFDKATSRIAASSAVGCKYALLVLVNLIGRVSKSDQKLQKM